MALIVCGLANPTWAGGFFIQEQSVSSVGRAHAGQAAIADDASTIFYNPAGMTRLDGPEAEIGGHVLLPKAELDDQGSSAATPGTLGSFVPVGGGEGGNPFGPTPVLDFYAATPVLDGDLWLGFGLSAPFGLMVEYDKGWFGRYDSTKTKLTVIDLAPTLAYRFTDFLSIGAALNVQYADATLENMIPNPLTPGGPTPATDGFFKVEGDSWSVGFNVGVMVKPTERTRIGLNYRSAITHHMEGSGTISGLTGPLAVANGTSGISADLNLPDISTLAVAFEATGNLTLLGHFIWFGWSRLDEIRIKFDNGNADAVIPANYDDSFAVAVGAEYRLNKTWLVRGGFQFDDTPTVTGYRDTRVPDEDRYWVALGASYRLSDRMILDISYAHLFLDEARIDVARTFFADVPGATSTANIDAVSDTDVDVISLKFRMNL